MSATSLSNLSVTDLEGELRRREREINKLTRKRDKLASELADVEAQIRSMGGPSLGGRRRPRNEQSLADALADALTGVTMSVSEVAEAVQQQGYRTTSPNFRTIVNQTLLKDSRFKRVGRGQYTTKGAGGGSGESSAASKPKKKQTRKRRSRG